jgi:hypothetical protein
MLFADKIRHYQIVTALMHSLQFFAHAVLEIYYYSHSLRTTICKHYSKLKISNIRQSK